MEMEGLHEEHRPVIVGVAGGSGSGKTTLTRAILETVGADDITFICHDSYYKDLSHLTMVERDNRNFDHPDALDTDILVQNLIDLKKNQTTSVPVYDYKTHTRLPNPVIVYPRKVIIVEGVLIFADPNLVNEFDIKLFVDTDSDIRFIRRLQRDIEERERTTQSVIEQYLSTVRPMHELYVEPSKKHADIIIPSGNNAVALDLIALKLKTALMHGNSVHAVSTECINRNQG